MEFLFTALPGISNIDGGKGIVHQVMCGNHDNLPDPLTNAVRIYVCSPVTGKAFCSLALDM